MANAFGGSTLPPTEGGRRRKSQRRNSRVALLRQPAFFLLPSVFGGFVALPARVFFLPPFPFSRHPCLRRVCVAPLPPFGSFLPTSAGRIFVEPIMGTEVFARPPAPRGRRGREKLNGGGHSVGFPLPFVSAELHTAFKTWCWSAYVGGYLEMVDQFP